MNLLYQRLPNWNGKISFQIQAMRHKGFVDTSPPKQYPHLVLRLKQVQKEEERQAEIDHANQLLLHKMTDIMRKKGRVDNWNEYDAKRYV